MDPVKHLDKANMVLVGSGHSLPPPRSLPVSGKKAPLLPKGHPLLSMSKSPQLDGVFRSDTILGNVKHLRFPTEDFLFWYKKRRAFKF